MRIWLGDLWARIMPWKLVRRAEFDEFMREYTQLRQDYWDLNMEMGKREQG